MPLTKITVGEFDTSQGGLIVAGILTATSFNGDGASLTTLNASNISSGTLPDARFPATLPAVSGANLTGIFPIGTLMLFQQTSAPTGWTKETTHNDKALRVVTGAASSGGTTAFSSVMTSRTPAGSVTMSNAAFTLGTNEIPAHSHSANGYLNSGFNAGAPDYPLVYGTGSTNYNYTFGTNNTGGGGSHTHSNTASFSGTALDFAIQYVDLIIASKN